MLQELEIYVDEPADYEPRGDHIVANWKGRHFHIPIAVATRIEFRLGKALDKWRAENNGAVVEMSRKHG